MGGDRAMFMMLLVWDGWERGGLAGWAIGAFAGQDGRCLWAFLVRNVWKRSHALSLNPLHGLPEGEERRNVPFFVYKGPVEVSEGEGIA